jgi:hypothetical protein
MAKDPCAGEDTFTALTRLLYGDVQTLFELIIKHRCPISEANIRAASTILRRWLVDGDAKRLNAQLLRPMEFSVLHTAPVVERVEVTRKIDFFLTAGVMMNGQPVQGIYHSPFKTSENDVIPLLPMSTVRMGLKEFVGQRRLYYQGRWFTTEEIIRYVANKLGGNHYDADRPSFYGQLDQVSAFMRYGGPGDVDSGSELYLVLEPDSAEIIDGVHLEVVAAAASFIQAIIGDTKLVTLTVSKSSLLNPRRWMRRKKGVVLIDRASDD